MTPALQAVLSQLTSLDVIAEFKFGAEPPPRLIIPAKNAETGGITVFDEPHELTIELEGKHHSHFQTPEEAAVFVADIITEKVCVTGSVELTSVGLHASWAK